MTNAERQYLARRAYYWTGRHLARWVGIANRLRRKHRTVPAEIQRIVDIWRARLEEFTRHR